MSHRIGTPKDAPHAIDRDAVGYCPAHGSGTPCGDSHADRDAYEAAWVRAVDRARAEGVPIRPPRRTVANVRDASTVARWCLFVFASTIALLAFIGAMYLAAYLWEN